MNEGKTLNQVWLKASVLGSLWASSEIVLGSFLHNLKIPFSGNILTAIGIILLISVAFHWKEKGLFWRAGLICALMKAISPSAVIFGPMIAIFCEALLMEIAVQIFHRTIVGYLLAGMLAMSWNFVQFILNYLIMYGFKIFNLYVDVFHFIEKQLHISVSSPWLLILILIFIYVIMGLLTSLIGIYIGKKINKAHIPLKSLSVEEVQKIKQTPVVSDFPFSLNWLFINVFLILTVFILMGFASWKIWITVGLMVVIIWFLRYPNNFKRLLKPAFWLSLLIIAILSALVYYEANKTMYALTSGLIAGVEMNIRAIILIVGFSVIGTELRNPAVGHFFSNTSFKNSQIAVELAFATLPDILAAMPSIKDFLKKPLNKIWEMISYIDFWLEKAEFKMLSKENIVIITGTEKTGKSTVLMELVDWLQEHKYRIAGFVSPSVVENNIHVGYDIIDLQTRQRVILSRVENEWFKPHVGNYYFNTEGIAMGNKSLSIDYVKHADIVVVDEIGPWELKHQGWAHGISILLKEYQNPMLWVVRESLVDKVISYYSLKNPCIIHIKDEDKFQKIWLFLHTTSK